MSNDTGGAGPAEALVSKTRIEDVERISRRATLIKKAQLNNKMNHKITEGDVWAVIEAIREITHTG